MSLGLERFYVALTHMHHSPYHLVYLFHALGKAALETKLLSDSNSTVEAVEPLSWMVLRQLIESDNNMLTLSDEDVEFLDGSKAIRDGPNRATDIMVIDEDINYSTEEDTQVMLSDPLLMVTINGTIKDLKMVCKDDEVEGKQK